MMDIALDFGTTNSVLAWRDPGRRLYSWRFDCDGKSHDTYRSVLYVEPEEDAGGKRLQVWAGPAAIAEYNRFGESGRLLQSLKSHLASPHFTGTQIFGTSFTLEQLIARFLRQLREDAEASDITVGNSLTIGRPVRFVGEGADETLALTRLQQAFTQAGFDECRFVEEPIAAAYAFAQRAQQPGRVLIADLGGGTTDYAIVDIISVGACPELKIIATGGVGVAGDDLDAAIIDKVVTPQLGQGTVLKNGQPVPQWLYNYVRRWHHLSFLRTPQNLTLIRDLIGQAKNPQPLERLLALITDNQGFALAQAVGAAKQQLSTQDAADFQFGLGDSEIKATIMRTEFEKWIEPHLRKMRHAAEATLTSAGILPSSIDHVFMTGGTSYVPAVKRLFTSLLTRAEQHHGDELTSVAAGLALQAGAYQ